MITSIERGECKLITSIESLYIHLQERVIALEKEEAHTSKEQIEKTAKIGELQGLINIIEID